MNKDEERTKVVLAFCLPVCHKVLVVVVDLLGELDES